MRPISSPLSSDLSYYDLLDLSRDASRKEIQYAYWEKARRYHPDSSARVLRKEKDGDRDEDQYQFAPDVEDALFIKIQEAYEVLSDSQKRDEYDRKLDKTSSTPNAVNLLIGECIDFEEMEIEEENLQNEDDEEDNAREDRKEVIVDLATQQHQYPEQCRDELHREIETRSYPCRCGEVYILSVALPMPSPSSNKVDDIPEDTIVRIIPCSGCSLHLKVFINI